MGEGAQEQVVELAALLRCSPTRRWQTGVLGLLAARVLLVETRRDRAPSTLDTPGAVLVTGGLMALVYAIVGTSQHAWTSTRTLATLGVAVVLLGWFLYHEARVRSAWRRWRRWRPTAPARCSAPPHRPAP